MLRIILGVLLAVTLAVLITLNVVNVVQVKGHGEFVLRESP